MGKIVLDGMLFKSHIGVYDYEQFYGNNFEVDVMISSETITGASDELADTINYDIIYSIAREVMHKRFNLIESACRQILDRILEAVSPLDELMVRVTKLHPPLGGEVKKVAVEMNWAKNK